MTDEWIPIIMFVSFAVVFSCWLYFRYRTRQAVQDTVQAAIEKGHELTPDFLASLGQPKASGDTDLRRGVISVALAIGFAVFAIILNEEDALRPMLGVAAFPGVIGVAYLSLWLFAGKKDA